MLSKDLMAEVPGGRLKAALTSYNVHYVHAEAPGDVRLERVLAPNVAAAFNMADELFPRATILRIRKTPPHPQMNAYPDARFIRGAFHPFHNDDQPPAPSPAE